MNIKMLRDLGEKEVPRLRGLLTVPRLGLNSKIAVNTASRKIYQLAHSKEAQTIKKQCLFLEVYEASAIYPERPN